LPVLALIEKEASFLAAQHIGLQIQTIFEKDHSSI
jgi:hypothetical protein